MDLTVKETERSKHGYDIVKGLALGEFDAIVTISGDGLIHEVVNGIMSRKDKNQFLQSITLGFIPGGTANGLVASVIYTCDEEYGIREAAFLAAKG